jgi:hypothetical protein
MGVCTLALMGGQYLATGRAEFLVIAVIVVFVDMFRYVNGFHLETARSQMRGQLGGARDAVFLDEVVEQLPAGPAAVSSVTGDQPVVDIHGTFRSRFSIIMPLRNWLVRHRIRPNLVSGIEFQMFVLVIAPLTGLILPVTIVALALMLGFEAVLIYKFWLSTRDFDRVVETADPHGEIPAPRPEAPTEPAGVFRGHR